MHDEPWRTLPPVDSNRPLTIWQIELIRRWVEQGAESQPHLDEQFLFLPTLSRPPLWHEAAAAFDQVERPWTTARPGKACCEPY